MSKNSIRKAAAATLALALCLSLTAPALAFPYTVEEGDNLWKLAQRYLGDGARYTEICEANRGTIRDPNLIYTGQVIEIPDGAQAPVQPEKPAQPEPPAQPKAEVTDAAIIEAVYENFLKLAAVPRPSKHEKQISDFLAAWAKEQGAQNVVQDEANNLIFDLNATAGYESKPLTVLQAHMDMVCVAAEGVSFDALSDPIKVIRDDAAGTLTADGTSLGGDDGAGVAVIMAVTQGKLAHGPVRIILTTDEEQGMSGVLALDGKYVADAKYLINLDNEAADEVVLSTAAGLCVYSSGSATARAPSGDTPLTLELKGLAGGHSGIEINKGRCNGVIAMARLLQKLNEAGVVYELASLTGGTADNAIPAAAKAVIVVDSGKSTAKAADVAAAFQSELEKEFAGIESGFTLRVSDAEPVAQVVSDADRAHAIRYLTEMIDGVHTMSQYVDGLVESSSNLGVFSLDAEGFIARSYIRSSDAALLDEIGAQQTTLAADCGYTFTTKKVADAWPYDPDNALLPIVREVYQRLNGTPVKEVSIHAGLECGTFALLNPTLNMISIGPDVHDVHSPNETLYLNSIPKTWRLLEGILAELS